MWAAHFLLSYVTAALSCAKAAGPGGSLGTVRMAMAIYTVLALTGIASWAGAATGGTVAGTTHSRTTTTRRRIGHRFLGFATLLLSALSAVAVVYAAVVAVVIARLLRRAALRRGVRARSLAAHGGPHGGRGPYCASLAFTPVGRAEEVDFARRLPAD
jgi:hypothetical protein